VIYKQNLPQQLKGNKEIIKILRKKLRNQMTIKLKVMSIQSHVVAIS